MTIRSLLVICMLCVAAAARAGEVLSTDVSLAGDAYEVDFAVVLDGDADRAWELIADYSRFQTMSPTVRSARLISGTNGGEARIEVVLRPCVLMIFCKTITKTSDVRVNNGRKHLQFTAVAGIGDFREARETIRLSDASGGNRKRVLFRYSAVLNPAFYVPPFVGPWLIKRAIIKDLKSSSRRVERMLAHGDAADG